VTSGTQTTCAPPALAVEQLTKDFPAVRALDAVSLSFRAGEVHALVGENGAGKSTLMKILSGVYQPTSGTIRRDGEVVAVAAPAEANRLGIAMVHQELNLVEELSVAENIFLGRERTACCGWLRRRETHAEARGLLDVVGLDVPPTTRVGDLSIARRQMVEIAKALSFEAGVLILDEPTAVLGGPEVRTLFGLVGRLRERGVCVIYISHILPEVQELADRATVLRDGRVVTTLDRSDIPAGEAGEAKLAGLMVGRPMEDHFPDRLPPGERTVLRVSDLVSGDRVKGVSFAVRAGEILGFAGLVGAGRTELAEAIMGLRRRDAGRIELGSEAIAPREMRRAVDAGLAYLSEDRRGKGLLVDRSVRENATLASLRRFSRGLLRMGAERRAVEEQVARLRIKAGGLDDPLTTLSGGNQQKVALGKWLLTRPKVLLLDEPTRGVDIGAKEEIYLLIRGLAESGMACVMVSSELNELLGMCHRIAVMRQGRVSAVLEGSEMTEQNVMFHAAGVGAAGTV
jgi:ribose transport system ATP-binding protein